MENSRIGFAFFFEFPSSPILVEENLRTLFRIEVGPICYRAIDMQDLSLSGKRWHTDGAARDIPSLIEKRLAQLHGTQERPWDDASVFPDITKAVTRLREAMQNDETIAIFGDYDCDGVTSTAQLVRCIRRWGSEPVVRLPHRVTDGYGLKPQHIEEFTQNNVSLLITVDTGITAHDAIAKANEKGIDVIVLDHHHWTVPPDAFAIVHPGFAPAFAPPHPSAAGVTFLFVQAMEGGHWPERDVDLALALFGTVADLVPLAGVNRRLVEEGLEALRRLPAGPVKDFVEMTAGDRRLTSVDIAFRIAPRINAAGRMADPTLALTALLEGGAALRHLGELNAQRQEETARCIEHALNILTENGDKLLTDLPAFLAVADETFAPGIVGLISGKLTERFGRPSMAVHMHGTEGTASLRSTPSYNIVEGLHRIAPLLTSFGGHSQAAGCTFPLAHLAAITDALNEDVRSRVETHLLLPSIGIDAITTVGAVTNNAIALLDRLQPFGQGNTEPLFLVRNVRLENVRRIGQDSRHLQATADHCKVIGFGFGEWDAHAKEPLDLVCKLGIDTWNGRMRPQLFVQDARVSVPVSLTMSNEKFGMRN